MALLCSTPARAQQTTASQVSEATATEGQDSGSAINSLKQMSLEQLSNIQVTSVSKRPQPLSDAPASIYVITPDEIVRSGALNVPEALRLAPNLTVTQLSATNYVVAARGLGGNPGDQNFSNKLLMLIDGRSVYTPLYSGIYLDAQDVLLEDVDRIEVISGPGATLWGANAMNGVINIITRSAVDTRGALVNVGAGNKEQNVDARYGARLNDEVAYRFYGMGFHDGAEQLPNGASAQDGWSKLQGGFRVDYQHANDAATVEGDLYRAPERQYDSQDGVVSGADVVTHWQRQFSDRANLQVLAYFDQTERFAQGAGFALHTYDLELQDSLPAGASQEIIWGAGERVYDYGIINAAALLFIPASRDLTLGDAFVQDTISLGRSINVIAGFKMEDDPYSGWSALPDLRATWNFSGSNVLWAAASRSIRSPTPFDVDTQEKIGSVLFLSGNPDFRPEKLTAYQLGYRSQPSSVVSLSASVFYNDYTDLRTIEFSHGPAILEWANLMRGATYGVEAWADLQLTSWWRLGPGLRTVHENFKFEPGSFGLLGTIQAGNDPSYQAEMTSSMDLRRNLALDASLRYVSSLPDPALPGYYDLMARIRWQLSDALRLSLAGQNLLHRELIEYPAPSGEDIGRSVLLDVTARF
jgi:iron complex outermembrane recepter protein